MRSHISYQANVFQHCKMNGTMCCIGLSAYPDLLRSEWAKCILVAKYMQAEQPVSETQSLIQKAEFMDEMRVSSTSTMKKGGLFNSEDVPVGCGRVGRRKGHQRLAGMSGRGFAGLGGNFKAPPSPPSPSSRASINPVSSSYVLPVDSMDSLREHLEFAFFIQLAVFAKVGLFSSEAQVDSWCSLITWS